MPEELKANQEAKLYGLRYLSTYAHELGRNGEKDPALVDQALFVALIALHARLKRSQLGQDIFALAMNGFMQNGYFVEVGAHDAENLSNTWMLEKGYDWNGLLLEPNEHSVSALRAKRSAPVIERAAWHRSGERLPFHAVADSALSSMGGIQQNDNHDRSSFETIEVETITLNDALAQSGAPHVINFMSIDVEGAELAVLDGLDLTAWEVRSFTIEYNHDHVRLAEYDRRLGALGYVRLLPIISDFDAWYAKADAYEAWRQSFVFPGRHDT